jgi:hypothetical protein
MNFTRIILAAAAVIIVGGFAFLALTDVPVEHSQIQKTIPNDRFLKNH